MRLYYREVMKQGTDDQSMQQLSWWEVKLGTDQLYMLENGWFKQTYRVFHKRRLIEKYVKSKKDLCINRMW